MLRTDTKKVLEACKMTIELMPSIFPNSKAIQDLLSKFGAKQVMFKVWNEEFSSSVFMSLCVPNKCTGCMACIKPCPQGAITGELKKLHSLDQSKYIKCGACYETCRFDAIIIK